MRTSSLLPRHLATAWDPFPLRRWQAASLTLIALLLSACSSAGVAQRVDLDAIPDSDTFAIARPDATAPEAAPLVMTGLPGPLEPAQYVVLHPPDWPEDNPPILAWTEASANANRQKAQLLLLAGTPEKDIPPGAIPEPVFADTEARLLEDALDKRIARVLAGVSERPRIDRGALHTVAPDDVFALLEHDARSPRDARVRSLFAVDTLSASSSELRLLSGSVLPGKGEALVYYGHLPALASRIPEVLFVISDEGSPERPLPGSSLSAEELVSRARESLSNLSGGVDVDYVALPRDSVDPVSAWFALETHAILVTLTDAGEAWITTPIEAPIRVPFAVPSGAIPLDEPVLLDHALRHAFLVATGRPQDSLTLGSPSVDDGEDVRRLRALDEAYHACARYALSLPAFGRHVRLDLGVLAHHASALLALAAQLELTLREEVRDLEDTPAASVAWQQAYVDLLRVHAALAGGDLEAARVSARALSDAPAMLANEALGLTQAMERDVEEGALHPLHSGLVLEGRGRALLESDPSAGVVLLEAAVLRYGEAGFPGHAERARVWMARALYDAGRAGVALTFLMEAALALDVRRAHRDAGNAWLRATLWMHGQGSVEGEPESDVRLREAQLHSTYAAAHDAFAAANLPRKLAVTHLVGSQLIEGEARLDALVAATLYAHIAADPEQLAAAELALVVTLAQGGASADDIVPHLERAERFAEIADVHALSEQLHYVREQLGLSSGFE